eukprot:18102-Heterococcus_DN1.PRE.4
MLMQHSIKGLFNCKPQFCKVQYFKVTHHKQGPHNLTQEPSIRGSSSSESLVLPVIAHTIDKLV